MLTDELRDDDPDVAVLRVLRQDASADPATDPFLPDEVLARAYREMRRLRVLGARMTALCRQGRIGSGLAAPGREAISIATGLAARTEDWIFPTSHAESIMLVRGFPMRSLLAQAFANAADPLKGRQTPGQASGRAVHQVSASPWGGRQLSHAVGAAWAMRARKSTAVAVAFLDERTTSQGDFHAAMNLAGLWRAPCVIVCHAGEVPWDGHGLSASASCTVAVKGRAYGVPGVRVDGGDLLAAYAAISSAIERARGGAGPTFIEAVGRGAGPGEPPLGATDPGAPPASDPLDRLRRYMAGLGLVSEAADAALDDESAAEIDAAIAALQGLPPPDAATLVEDVYAEPPWHLRAAFDQLKKTHVAPTRLGAR